MAKPRRLSPSTPHTFADAERWYREQMGQEALERNKQAAAKENGQCICEPSKLKVDGGVKMIHHESCPKYKKWMGEAVEIAEKRKKGL